MRIPFHRAKNAVVDPVLRFLNTERSGGIALLAATLVALAWANSPWSASYEAAWSTELTLGVAPVEVSEDLQHWINEGLMALFFFVVGLEIKRELVAGELRKPRAAVLPVLAATGGVVLPAILFLLIVGSGPEQVGWGIPVATDIAFAVGVLSLLGNRVPSGARVLLLSIAIVDDVLAILIIAIFYTQSLTVAWLGAAAAGLVLVVLLRLCGVRAMWPYVLVGVAVWYSTYESGVHATITGVALGLMTPARPFRGRDVLGQLESRLHPVTASVIIPLFALANAGVELSGGLLADAAQSRLTWGIAVGLLAGKVLGIGLVTVLAIRFRIGRLPETMETRHVWGLAALAGIGFTVSLFITGLAFQDDTLIDQAKLGVFGGSLAASLLGVALILLLTSRNANSATKR